jgi:hypothetical protein
MTLFLDKIDSAPISNRDFDPQFLQWIWVLVDSLNENLTDIERAFNLSAAASYTAAQINTMQTATPSQLSDGIILYDTTNNEYVGRISGTLVKFTTAAYP